MKAQVNRVSIDYKLGGSGNRLIAIGHSLGMRGEIFDPVRPTVEKYGRFLTWDARGHGNSQKPMTGWTVEDLAADLRALIQSIDGDKAVIGGLSMGGSAAVAYAGAYSESLEGLILMDCTCWYGEGAQANWEQRAQTPEQKGMGAIIGFSVPRWFSEGFDKKNPAVVNKVAEILRANDPPSYGAACRALGRFDGREGLKRITCPTLIMVGEQDGATPVAMAEYLNQNIKNSKLHVLPGLKHFTAVEAPDRVGTLISDFLGSL